MPISELVGSHRHMTWDKPHSTIRRRAPRYVSDDATMMTNGARRHAYQAGSRHSSPFDAAMLAAFATPNAISRRLRGRFIGRFQPRAAAAGFSIVSPCFSADFRRA